MINVISIEKRQPCFCCVSDTGVIGDHIANGSPTEVVYLFVLSDIRDIF